MSDNKQKIKNFCKKKKYFVDIKDSGNKFFLDSKFKFKVILIGIDGEIKYQSDELEDLTKYFSIIDNMPIRQTEIEDDSSCNQLILEMKCGIWDLNLKKPEDAYSQHNLSKLS